MKNIYLFFIAIVLIASCTKESSVVKTTGDLNGNDRYLKHFGGHSLYAACAKNDTLTKGIKVGTVTYSYEDPNFVVTYECTGGWQISESHMYAGLKASMPLNGPGNPKVGRFTYSGNHNPWLTTVTYTVPLSSLPDPEDPGFVVASHCIVHGPTGRTETAWAVGTNAFNDKGGGWYDAGFEIPTNVFTIIFGTVCSNGLLDLYNINVSTGVVTLILEEQVGNASGTYDGTAYDVANSMFFFVNYNTFELWRNNLSDSEPSVPIDTLPGPAVAATFYDGAYWYVNANNNSINVVTFNGDWSIESQNQLIIIPTTILSTINDIAMYPGDNADTLYIVGEGIDGTELIAWPVYDTNFYSVNQSVGSGAQIAFGSDDILYVFVPGDGGTETYTVNPVDGTLTLIESGVIIIPDDPFATFSDVATGPIM